MHVNGFDANSLEIRICVSCPNTNINQRQETLFSHKIRFRKKPTSSKLYQPYPSVSPVLSSLLLSNMTSSQQQMQLLASLLANHAFSRGNPNVASMGAPRRTPSASELERLLTLSQVKPVSLSRLDGAPNPTAWSLPKTTVPSPPLRSPALLSERQKFVLFVRILMKYLDRLNNPTLKTRAKIVIAECTQRNRLGLPEYTPLMSAVERRLKQNVGEIHVVRAKVAFHSYLRKSVARSLSPTAIQAV